MSFEKALTTSTIRKNGTTVPPEPVACRNKTWRDAEGQKETVVRLERLPPGLVLPDNFPEPLTYDPARKLLRYRGLMFSGSYSYLRKLSGDPAYLTALDQLFIGTSCPASKVGRWTLLAAGIVAAALAVFASWWLLRGE